MKLIKKIVAIMFAFMMVVSMSCNVKADEGTSSTKKGTITINNAIPGQTYKIYKILELESYNPTTKNYAYKVTPEWKSFVENEGQTYLTKVDGTDYVNWVGDSTNDGAHVKEFAEKAIAYVKKENSPVKKYTSKDATAASAEQATTTVTFENLPLGYYLVESSVGTLCSLDTTNTDAIIREKNGVPSVDKKVSSTETGNYDTSNTASIGDTVYFKTTITAQPGAQNYVLHDKMDAGLTFNEDSVKVNLRKKGTSNDQNLTKETHYNVETTNLHNTDPKCTFHIEFTPKLCESLKADDTITVTYSATLNENAVIAGEGNKNETWLKYGENNNLETTHPTTDTKTFEMHVFKFYKDKKNSDKETGLADAVFTLKKVGKTNTINFVKETPDEINGDIYRVAKTGETGTVTTITSPDSGKFTIKGLSAGTYKLEETKQPAGYNKLSGPVTVVIDMDGKVTVGGTEVTQVDVENKTGTVLPSTGGAGTTMIYLIGGALVLGSGVVLVTKRRVKGK